MIARAMLVWLAIIIPAGFALYQVKFEVRALEEQLSDMNKQAQRDQDAIQVLRAEWSFLNEPKRIETLNQRHLGLGSKSANRMREIDSIPLRPSQAAPAAPSKALPTLPPSAPEPRFAPAMLEPLGLVPAQSLPAMRDAVAQRPSGQVVP
ncbi:MAG: hypothetical protein JNK11_01805 [Alphaproteobacteria bacterium]|nr:hypothetical protein [Alphaproteobacteria bacterium]